MPKCVEFPARNLCLFRLFQFHVSPSGVGFDLVLRIPVVIGTIPLREAFSNFSQPPGNQKYQQPNPLPVLDFPPNSAFPPTPGFTPTFNSPAPPPGMAHQTQGFVPPPESAFGTYEPSAPYLPTEMYPDLRKLIESLKRTNLEFKNFTPYFQLHQAIVR